MIAAEDLDTKTNAETPLTFPNGCHIAEVEIDPTTGAPAKMEEVHLEPGDTKAKPGRKDV